MTDSGGSINRMSRPRLLAELRDNLIPSTRAAGLSLTAIILSGFLLRFLISPWAPVHANNHGIQEIRVLLDNSLNAIGKSGPYGDTFFILMNILLTIFGRSDQVLFRLNAVFGTLSIAALYLLAKALRFQERTALFAALLLCLSPSQVWLAGTESQMPLHLCLGLTGLVLLLSSLRTTSAPSLWTAAILVSISATLHVATIPFFLVALAVACSEGLPRTAWKDRGFRSHIVACLILTTGAVCLHALSIDDGMLLRGIGEFDAPHRLAAWMSSSNILWDPTLTPLAVVPLALAGIALMCRQRPITARSLVLAAILTIPLSFSVCACRTDALRYQTPTHWIYYLFAAFSSSGPLPGLAKPYLKKALFAAVCLFIVATALPGLTLLKNGDEESQEYHFMRQVADPVGPTTFLWLPARTATRLLQTEFPNYVNGLPLLRGKDPDPFDEKDSRLVYLGLDCYRWTSGEDVTETIDARSGLRKECLAACAGSKATILETALDAKPPSWGYQKRYWPLSRQHPTVGLYRCQERRRDRR